VRRRLAILLVAAAGIACERREVPPVPAPGPRHYLVGPQGAETRDGRRLLPGFGVAIVEQRFSGGEWLGRTSLGRVVAMQDLRPARPFRFAGAHLRDGRLDQGWVVRDGAPVFAQPEAAAQPVARKARYERLPLARLDGAPGYHPIAGGWMREGDLRVPRLAPRPAEVGPEEAWLDVDLATQTLVAYQGDVPVFATLVATGVGAEGTTFATPKGVHRVRGKRLAATMDNLEHTGVVPYAYEEVPHTQYIGRVALHGVFWHDQLGQPRSHGCINLSPADAEWLFAFTRPEVPAGETQATASDERPGTVVRVR